MSQPALILASGSPRRRQLLDEAGYTFRVVTARDGVEEQAEQQSRCTPHELVTHLAKAKGQDVLQQIGNDSPALLLAADTVAEHRGVAIGKPADEDSAREILQTLSGQEHQVHTGLFLAWTAPASEVRIEEHGVSTTLQMDPLSEEWIDAYVASGQWRGKAGGFGYQDGLGFVRILQGSESNVVGLPMELVRERLAHYQFFPKANS